jgi:hypothetical protein
MIRGAVDGVQIPPSGIYYVRKRQGLESSALARNETMNERYYGRVIRDQRGNIPTHDEAMKDMVRAFAGLFVA